MRLILSLGLATLLVGGATGCGEGRSEAAVGEGPRDADGVALDLPGLSAEVVATIGGAGAPAEEILYTVPVVVERPGGGFYVLNYGDKRVLSFDAEGAFVRSIGGPGQGPGEFTSPVAMATDTAGGLFVLDAGQSRITHYPPDTMAPPVTVPLGMEHGLPTAMAGSAEGSLYVEFRAIQGLSEEPGHTLARVDPATGSIDPRVRLDPVEQIPVTSTAEGRRVTRFIEPPFAPSPVWTPAAGALVYGDGSSYSLRRTRDGETATLFQVDAEPAPVTPADRARFADRNPDLDPSDDLVFPEVKPHFTELRSDPRGWLWLRTGLQEWEVREADGRRIGAVTLPTSSRLVGIGRQGLYLIRMDEADVETLVKLELRPGASAPAGS